MGVASAAMAPATTAVVFRMQLLTRRPARYIIGVKPARSEATRRPVLYITGNNAYKSCRDPLYVIGPER